MTFLSGSDAASPTPAAYRAQLDTLVSLLRAANAMPGMGDAVLLESMVDALQRDANALPLPGVAELLRSWQAALRDLARADGTPSEDDLVRMTLWFTGLQEHLAGRLDRDGRRMLAELPEGIRWLPKLSPGFVHAIARRLELSAPPSEAAPVIATPLSAESVAADAVFAEPLEVESTTDEAVAVETPVEMAVETTAIESIAVEADAPAFVFEAPAVAAEADDAIAATSTPPDIALDDIGLDNIALDDAAADDSVAPTHDDAVHATDDTAAPATLWIGRDELDLTRQAIADQVMPLAQAWAEALDGDDATAAAGHVVELTYQTQLIANVMALIGTPMLERGVLAVNAGLERGDPAIGPDTVAAWCGALLGVLEAPGRDSGELLALVSDGIPGLDADWATALGNELDRVMVGLDPALVAQRKTVAEFDDIGLAPADDVLPSVLEGMYRELPGNAARFGASVRALVDTRSPEPIDEARRVAHTLKGDANTVGIRGLANLTHALEDILLVLNKHPERLDDACADLLTTASDTVEEIADHLLGRGPAPDHLLDVYQQVLDTANALADDATPPSEAATRAAVPADDTPTATPSPLPATAAPAPQADTTAGGMAASGIQSLNVPSALLDELQRLSGEGLVTSRQIDQQLDGLGAIHREQRQSVRSAQDLIARLDDLVALRGAALQSTAQKAGAELDPLEIDQYNELHVISRQLLESHADSAEFMRRIERIMNALAELRSGQEQLNRDLQRTILRTRTVPFGQIAARLQRIVRQTAKQVFKPVRLDIVGEEIPVDAELLERIVEPLAHLLRNAVDHGIEPPAVRTAAGKPETGVLTLRVGLQGDAALIDLQDDGAGLDLVAIRKRAIEAGLLEAHYAIDERTLARMILLPGFSTRTATTEVSGRGIGMDVVERRIAALRGTLTLSTETGRGTRVQLRLPVTQTLANVIVARGQRQPSAVVAASIERVVSFGAGECREVDGRLVALVDGETAPALPIEAFYGETADPAQWANGGIGLYLRDTDGIGHVVLVRGIDEVRSVVVKPLAAYLPPIPAVRGITQLGDGGLAPVIDLDVLLRAARERRFDIAALAHDTVPVQRVVVADDSLSVRRALEQLMQDAGFEVATARDGFEALAAVQAKPTQALLIDLEMPRMNGLEVARNLRNHAETRDLPVVMITSRATDKHRAMAEEAGVTRLLGKPFAEDALVALVRDLIAAQA